MHQNGKSCQTAVTSGGGADVAKNSKTSFYVNLHSASSKSFLIQNLPDSRCDVYQEKCLNMAVVAYTEVFGTTPDEQKKADMLSQLKTMRVSELRLSLRTDFFVKILPALLLSIN